MNTFKKGDTVRFKNSTLDTRTVLDVHGDYVWTIGCGSPSTYHHDSFELAPPAMPPLPIPPNGKYWEYQGKRYVLAENPWRKADQMRDFWLWDNMVFCGCGVSASAPEYGYRFILKEIPSVRRWDQDFWHSQRVHVPLVDDGSGPKLDTDKIVLGWLGFQGSSRRCMEMYEELKAKIEGQK